MAAQHYVENDITYLECKECQKYKTLSEFYKHSEWFLGVLGRCRICIRSWRKTEKELQMARVRDKVRYTSNPNRRSYVFKSAKERRAIKWYSNIHVKTARRIKKLWNRPEVCPICKIQPLNWRIEAHHFDYSKWNEIIFCCSICHSKLDSGKMPPREDLITVI